MTKRPVIRRDEMLTAMLELGGGPIDLADYATTGLMAVAVGPRGSGKTNAGLLIAEQLSQQGWVSVLVDPEAELESLYGDAVQTAEDLQECLTRRDRPIVVINAKDAEEFVPFGEAILQAADTNRQPIFCMIDEGQLYAVRLHVRRIVVPKWALDDLLARPLRDTATVTPLPRPANNP